MYFGTITFALVGLAMTAAVSAQAQDRHIHVNGEHLYEDDIALLDHLANGAVANGFYWLDLETGAWGYEGNPEVQGHLDMSRAQTAPGISQDNNRQHATPTPYSGAGADLVGAWTSRRNYGSGGIYQESTTKWVFSGDGTVAWGSGTVIAGGSAGVTLRGGGSSPAEYGQWSVSGNALQIQWNDGTFAQWQYEVFEYDGSLALALVTTGGSRTFLKKID